MKKPVGTNPHDEMGGAGFIDVINYIFALAVTDATESHLAAGREVYTKEDGVIIATKREQDVDISYCLLPQTK